MKVDKVRELIEISERKYLGYEEALFPIQNWLRKHFKYPIMLLIKGSDFVTKEVFLYAILYIPGFYLATDLIQKAPIEIKPIVSNFILAIVIFGPLFLVLFLPPSAYTKSKISDEITKLLRKKLLDVDTGRYIEILNISSVFPYLMYLRN